MAKLLINSNGRSPSLLSDVAAACAALVITCGTAPLLAQPSPAAPPAAGAPTAQPSAPVQAAPAQAPAAAPIAPAAAPPPAAPPVAAPPPAVAPTAAPPLAADAQPLYPPAYAPIPGSAAAGAPPSAPLQRVPREPHERMMLGINYSMGFATGDLKDFVGDPSFRGFDMVALWPIYKSLYIGGALGYGQFYEERSRATYQVESGAITAKLYRYVDYWSTSFVTRYFFMEPEARLRPYAGLRLGLSSLIMTTLVADLSNQDGPLGFLLAPEAGLMVRFSNTISGSIAYQYNFSTASARRFENLSFGALQFGLVIQWDD